MQTQVLKMESLSLLDGKIFKLFLDSKNKIPTINEFITFKKDWLLNLRQ